MSEFPKDFIEALLAKAPKFKESSGTTIDTKITQVKKIEKLDIIINPKDSPPDHLSKNQNDAINRMNIDLFQTYFIQLSLN